MDYEDYMEEEREWEEERQADPTCANCTYYYEEYGLPCCRIFGDPLENFETDRCEHWN